ncbi:hypothetical protein [Streptomyces minutiscleroticus]|uniref:Uncharacterized protein n=1 Tax=Streptomyces minutiscleroticus TaxID=68238 RepID=A0A918U4I2_9ACTN|nr:hypothetical protein [Streptomyces minutiscleroticus]GGX90642.1 hypothetical protein GCM10010358_50800 [Streptomyces minutiscleroticus]
MTGHDDLPGPVPTGAAPTVRQPAGEPPSRTARPAPESSRATRPVPEVPRVTRLVLGAADTAARAVAAACTGIPGHRPVLDTALLPNAALGLALEAQRRSLAAAAAAYDRTAPLLGRAARALLPSGWPDAAARRAAHWSERGRAERRRAREEAAPAVHALLRSVASAVVEQMDLDAVADRVDVNRIARRVDADDVLTRVDLVAYTEQVLDALDIGRIVRDTGGSITAETLDAVREQHVRADRLVQRITARVLRRNGTEPRGAAAPAPRPAAERAPAHAAPDAPARPASPAPQQPAPDAPQRSAPDAPPRPAPVVPPSRPLPEAP